MAVLGLILAYMSDGYKLGGSQASNHRYLIKVALYHANGNKTSVCDLITRHLSTTRKLIRKLTPILKRRKRETNQETNRKLMRKPMRKLIGVFTPMPT